MNMFINLFLHEYYTAPQGAAAANLGHPSVVDLGFSGPRLSYTLGNLGAIAGYLGAMLEPPWPLLGLRLWPCVSHLGKN